MTDKSNLDLQCHETNTLYFRYSSICWKTIWYFSFLLIVCMQAWRWCGYRIRTCSYLTFHCIIKFVFRRTLNSVECCWVFLTEVKMFWLRIEAMCVSCHILTFIPTATTKYGPTWIFFVFACLRIHILHLKLTIFGLYREFKYKVTFGPKNNINFIRENKSYTCHEWGLINSLSKLLFRKGVLSLI